MPNTNEQIKDQIDEIELKTLRSSSTNPDNLDDHELPRVTQYVARKNPPGLFQLGINESGVNQLLIDVLQGNEAEVLKIAKSNPCLFFVKSTAQDYAADLEGNRRTLVDWSPYQAMFGTGDSNMLYCVRPYLDTYLASLPNGKEMAAEQEQEKFPNGFKYPESRFDYRALVDAINRDQNILKTGQPNAGTLKEIEKFRAYFKLGEVRSGHHFNINDFIKAHKIYESEFKARQRNENLWWDSHAPKNNCIRGDFFLVFIVGFLERLMTAYQMQYIRQGYLNWDKPLNRSLEVVNHVSGSLERIAIFPLNDTESSCRLGLHFYIGSIRGDGAHAGHRGRPDHWDQRTKTLFKIKENELLWLSHMPADIEETNTQSCRMS